MIKTKISIEPTPWLCALIHLKVTAARRGDSNCSCLGKNTFCYNRTDECALLHRCKSQTDAADMGRPLLPSRELGREFVGVEPVRGASGDAGSEPATEKRET